MEQFIGQILLFAFPRVPSGWAACNGQLLSVGENEALFTLIGTTYGGDGVVNFAVPDLRGRVPIGQGQAGGMSNYVMAQMVGTEQVSLGIANLPSHSHALQAASAVPAQGPTGVPSPSVGFATGGGVTPYTSGPSGAASVMGPGSVAVSGGNAAHDNMMPTLVMNYCIALQGIYPTQA